MKMTDKFAFTFLFLFLTNNIFSQHDSIKLVLTQFPTTQPASLIIDDKIYEQLISQNPKDTFLTFKIPILKGAKKLTVLLHQNGQSLSFTEKVQFTGSDFAYVRLKDLLAQSISPEVELFQYPLIEFYSAKGSHSIEIDNDMTEPTYTKQTVSPDKNHKLVWKNGNMITCTKTVKLKYNESKKYTCNENGTITEN